MKVVAINGSPRKEWNTAQMIKSAAKGAEDMGAEVKYYDLIDLKFKGCVSCFACKRLGGKSYGRCAQCDALKPVLDDILTADALIIGSPVYFSDVTADVRALCERLWFPGLAYSKENQAIYGRRIPVKIIFTENCPFPGFHKALNEHIVGTMDRLIGPAELLESVGTLQFDDYSKYETS
ncbi:MAG: flavodoxin family protein, partial [Oscillospiraceae bacterium]|nr:flavodoxin family protein [Oscillospiraceae bacterium]